MPTNDKQILNKSEKNRPSRVGGLKLKMPKICPDVREWPTRTFE